MVGYSEVILGPRDQVLVSRITGNLLFRPVHFSDWRVYRALGRLANGNRVSDMPSSGKYGLASVA
jgi:hypothetical protein